jgi:hypothetical protein
MSNPSPISGHSVKLTEDEITFLRSCVDSADRERLRLTLERDRWRRLLVDVVGELNAERMFINPEKAPNTPAPL